ncbi:centromere protein H-like [Cuculus canorus]|uniref:centromere protein H-like n=1 Tax=Cuculus canorus TaxID=55661 RepID=UPI0023AA6B28|nr:centromere protein H-like [Cuculus canorus]
MAPRPGGGRREAGREVPGRQRRERWRRSPAAAGRGRECSCGEVTEEDSVLNASQDLRRDIDEVKISLQNKAVVLQRTLLVNAIGHLGSQQEIYEKEQKSIDLRKQRFSLKQIGEQKWLQLPHLMKKQEEQESMTVSRSVKKLHDHLHEERELTTIIQTVFQIILMASNANWAEDLSLKEVVLKLETDAYLL